MKKIYAFAVGFCAFTISKAQNVNVTATAGTPSATYASLNAAFSAINSGVHQGAVSVAFAASTVETTTAQLNASTTPASYTSITISATTPVTVTGSLGAPLIALNGATNVSIAGNGNLTLINSSAGGNVLAFTADASNNKIQGCIVQGSTSSVTSGIVSFAAGTVNGSDGNLIDNCTLNGSAAAANLIYSTGNTTSQASENSADTIRNCILRDIGTTIVSPAFIYLNSGNTSWVIQGNSLFQSAPAAITAQGSVRGIAAFPAYTSDAHRIIGNFIGGNAAGATGTMQLSATTVAIGFIGLDIETGGSGNLIRNNVVRNVNLTYNFSGGSFANAGIFAFIGGYSGTSTLDRNKIDNINCTNSGGTVFFNGIRCDGRVTANASTTLQSFYVTNDTVSNLTGTAGGSGAVQFFGIRFETSSSAAATVSTAISNPLFYAYGNLVSDISTTSTGTATILRGITNINTLGTTGTTPQLLPYFVVDSNTVRNFSSAGTPGAVTAPAVVGIYFTGLTNSSTIGDRQLFTRNQIYNLNATATADINNTVTGIYLASSRYNAEGNRIYGLTNTANGATNNPNVIGINTRAMFDSCYVFNNFISLGSGQANNLQIFGVLNNLNTTGPLAAYHNSVYINGGAAGNTKSSAAFMRGTETFGSGIVTPINLRNNILYNMRSGGSGAHYAVANTNTTPATGYVSDFNNLYSSNAATVALWGSTPNDIATYKTNSSDANSKSFTVAFIAPATGDLHLTGASVGDFNLKGAVIANIATDFDDQPRSTVNPYMGGDEVITRYLPVSLEFFTGNRQTNGNLLAWKADCSAVALATFEIERSGDSRKFSVIGNVYALAGQCAQPFNYIDAQPLPGINYYRLRITDAAGAIRYSNVIAILNKSTNFEMVGIYPNIVTSTAVISVAAVNKKLLQINVTDTWGRTNMQRSFTVSSGSSILNMDFSQLLSGTYLLTCTTTDGYTKTLRFVKQ